MEQAQKETWDERVARERSERATLTRNIRAMFMDVAKLLGEGWIVEPATKVHDEDTQEDRAEVYLSHPSGKQIYVSWNQYFSGSKFDGKLNISGSFDYGDRSLGISFPRDAERPEIGVSLSRGSVAIAKDIQRRFMPVYDKRYSEIAETVRTYTEFRDRKLGVSQRLGALASADPKRVTVDGFETYGSKGPYVKVKTYGDGVTVKVENCSEKLAAQIIKLVNDSRAE